MLVSRRMPTHYPADPFLGPFGLNGMALALGISPVVFGLIFVAVAIWSIVLKGIALWYAARGDQKVWFIVLLAVNTFGILELVYLLFFRPKKDVE